MGLVPLGVVTVMSTVPVPGGEVAVIWVGPSKWKLVAPRLSNSTSVAAAKSVPVIVTVVPPDSGPDVGLTPVTVGAPM